VPLQAAAGQRNRQSKELPHDALALKRCTAKHSVISVYVQCHALSSEEEVGTLAATARNLAAGQLQQAQRWLHGIKGRWRPVQCRPTTGGAHIFPNGAMFSALRGSATGSTHHKTMCRVQMAVPRAVQQRTVHNTQLDEDCRVQQAAAQAVQGAVPHAARTTGSTIA
jgi:hypothetical protein